MINYGKINKLKEEYLNIFKEKLSYEIENDIYQINFKENLLSISFPTLGIEVLTNIKQNELKKINKKNILKYEKNVKKIENIDIENFSLLNNYDIPLFFLTINEELYLLKTENSIILLDKIFYQNNNNNEILKIETDDEYSILEYSLIEIFSKNIKKSMKNIVSLYEQILIDKYIKKIKIIKNINDLDLDLQILIDKSKKLNKLFEKQDETLTEIVELQKEISKLK